MAEVRHTPTQIVLRRFAGILRSTERGLADAFSIASQGGTVDRAELAARMEAAVEAEVQPEAI